MARIVPKIKWQTYGQAGTVGNMCKDPDKDRVAAAGGTGRARVVSTFTVTKKLQTEDHIR